MNSLQDQVRALQGSAAQQPNWDSYGAHPVTDRTIAVADIIASRLAGMFIDGHHLDTVAPLKGGQIEISDGDHSIWIEIEVDDNPESEGDDAPADD